MFELEIHLFRNEMDIILRSSFRRQWSDKRWIASFSATPKHTFRPSDPCATWRNKNPIGFPSSRSKKSEMTLSSRLSVFFFFGSFVEDPLMGASNDPMVRVFFLGFPWGYPKIAGWFLWTGTSYTKMDDDLGVPLWLRKPPCHYYHSCNVPPPFRYVWWLINTIN